VSIEVKADLQAQRVAGAETGRLGSPAHELIPQQRRLLAGAQQLDAFLPV